MMPDDTTATEANAAAVFRATLLDAYRRRGGSPAMQAAGFYLHRHARGARLALAVAGACSAAHVATVDAHLEAAGILPIDAGPFDSQPTADAAPVCYDGRTEDG